MSRILSKSCWIMLAGLITATPAWAADSPIGALTADGKVSVTGQTSTFTLQDQQYAYFSGDAISTADDAKAVVSLSDGLDVTFVPSSEGRIINDDGTYTIELDQGHIVVDAAQGVDYQITHEGKPVSADQPLEAAGEPFVASVSESGDVQFYMPAQLDDDDRGSLSRMKGSMAEAGLSPETILIIAGIIGGAILIDNANDDEDSSS